MPKINHVHNKARSKEHTKKQEAQRELSGALNKVDLASSLAFSVVTLQADNAHVG